MTERPASTREERREPRVTRADAEQRARVAIARRPDLGPLPTDRGHEAVCGSAPVQSLGAVGRGTDRTAVFAPASPRCVRSPTRRRPQERSRKEIAVTLLSFVGWLFRFDPRSRTTGAGPMLATPEAQCQGPQTFDLALGNATATDADLARRAAAFRTPPRAWQLRPGTTGEPSPGTISADGALLTALKPAENRGGMILRLGNPTPAACEARLTTPTGALLLPVRLDEQPTGQHVVLQVAGESTWQLAPFDTLTLRISRRDRG